MKIWVLGILVILTTISCEKRSQIVSAYATLVAKYNPVLSQIKESRKTANQIIKKRIESEGNPYSMILSDFWLVEYVYQGGEPGPVKVLSGNWMKYKDDFTYEYGVYQDIIETGKYHLKWDEQEFILISDKKEEMPTAWEMKFKREQFILSGKSIFGKNKVDMKFTRISEIPTP